MTYIVGEGILKRMRQMQTQPASDEVYVRNAAGRTAWSEAMGMDGKAYRFLPATGQVLAFDPTSWVQAGAGPDPAPPVPTLPAPVVIDSVKGNEAGLFTAQPQGVILHGTRSGQNYTTWQEFDATVNYVRNGAGGLGWHVTVGDNLIATHVSPRSYAWHARSSSLRYLGCEFAQAKVDGAISDGQVAAFCWWWKNVARTVWPNMPKVFPTHAELDKNGDTGQFDGKSDVYPVADARADELRARIMARL